MLALALTFLNFAISHITSLSVYFLLREHKCALAGGTFVP